MAVLRRSAPWLCAIALLALALRAVGYDAVFPGHGLVELAPADSSIHARRALYSFRNFPAVLTFDPYMAWPDGARVPMPPLYDWLLGGVARLFGDSEAVFERVVAWVSPVFAALTVFPVYAIGRTLGGRGLGLGAALLFAVLPVGARRSMLGDVDHHAAVAFLGASWLALSVAHLGRDVRGAALWRCAAGLSLVRAALVLSWSGSFLYLVVGEGALLLGSIVSGRRAALWAQSAGALVGGLLVAPWLLAEPPAEPWTTVVLSWLQLLLLAAVAAQAAGLAWVWQRHPVEGAGRRLLVAGGLAVALSGLLLLAVPGLEGGLDPGLAFLGKQDTWGARNLEQQWLFTASRRAGALPLALSNYGFLAWLVPFVPLAALRAARDPARRPAALCVAAWAAPLGGLAVAQLRFGSDFAPVAAVGFALILQRAGAAFGRLAPALPSAPVSAALGAALLWPGLHHTFALPVKPVADPLSGGDTEERLSPALSLARFDRMIREATPESSGFLEPGGRPEYGVLVRPAQGHTLHYLARRAAPANNFGPYLDREKYLAVQRFYSAPTRSQALRIASRLGVRYLVTSAREAPGLEAFVDRLHRDDALVGSEAPAEHLRLVVEGPFGGIPPLTAFPSGELPTRAIPYKLFEIVEGAVLEARLPKGEEMEVRVQLVTNLGRRLPFRARAVAGAGGWARVRLPYPTGGTAPTRTVGPYRVYIGADEHRVRVSEQDVVLGRAVPLRPREALPAAIPSGAPLPPRAAGRSRG